MVNPFYVHQVLNNPKYNNSVPLCNKKIIKKCIKCGSDLKWFVTRYKCRNLKCREEYPHEKIIEIGGCFMSRLCPVCNKMIIYKNKPLWNGVLVWCSIHTDCQHCNTKVVLCYKGDHVKPVKDDDFVIITEHYYEKLMSKNKKDLQLC